MKFVVIKSLLEGQLNWLQAEMQGERIDKSFIGSRNRRVRLKRSLRRARQVLQPAQRHFLNGPTASGPGRKAN